ncbi:CCA tRNA nucleotidyltransferase [Pseudahrensia aquimaris]|uniref:CCA tRNA nucleotidyltransferase n=1 Tax=Pseudahrensia aquimaris TaxID=744461 RepID=A0ABW3FDC1_9HYPH
MIAPARIDQSWLHSPALQELLALLNSDGGEAKIAGGAVRNSLLGEAIKDVDVATTLIPADVTMRLEEAGHRAIPTGIDHGTVTALIDGETFEVTTLRKDIDTDGRHATVTFGTDWLEDAERRDFTMNALYLEADGTVFDPLGGYGDLMARNVIFIGMAEKRIEEDYLRILRFFRFFAWYGTFRPDAKGLMACTRLKDGLDDLSAERIWQELSRMLAAPDPSRALLWMRQTGVLSKVLPESENWGIDAIHGLVEAEQELGWDADAVLRLMSIIAPMEDKVAGLAERLKLSNKVRDRLIAWAGQESLPKKQSKQEFDAMLYRSNVQAVSDRIRLDCATAIGKNDEKRSTKLAKRLKRIAKWERPELPVRGQDLLDAGMKPGPQIAQTLTRLEEVWIASGFKASREFLLAKV